MTGSSGNAVTNLQTILTQMGYDPKTVDGKFGPNTEKAVIQFQEKNDLVKDGKVGKNTWAKLCALYNNQQLATTTTPPPAGQKQQQPAATTTPTPKVTSSSQYGGLLICKDCGKVNMNGISDKMTKIFPNINAIYIKHTGLPGEITSAVRSADGKSLHDQGLAIDLRTKHLSNDVVRTIVKDLKSLFDKDYDIIDEHNNPIGGVTKGPHIHIEYDPPKSKK